MIDKVIKVSMGVMAAAVAFLVLLFVTYFSVALMIGIGRLLNSY
jgi:hypothetical protein